ncbi:MAG: DUF4159 domain-containing protein [Rhodospirillaceae bacterium]|nr:DUF4159 domain-containing protein [Rhodospirillales bacterium]
MMALGPLAFAAPWALAATLLLPVLWWLLRVTPPAPRQLRFPAIRLLFGLEGREDTAARTPWWVLALRLLIAVLVILGAAHPLINPSAPLAGKTGPLVLVIDDGWASARDWTARRNALDDILRRAERAERPVMVLPTAPPTDGSRLEASTMMPASQARALVQALMPKPWAPDRAAAMEAVKAIPRDRVAQAVWLTDGIDDGNCEALARTLQTLGGGLEIVTGESGRLLLLPTEDPAGDRITVTMRGVKSPDRFVLRAVDAAGRVLGREEAALPAGQTEIAVPLRLPAELRNRLARLDIENEQGAGSVVLLDERWRRRPVGLSSGDDDSGAPLLAQLYYVERALAPSADLHRGGISELLGSEMAVLMLADVPAVLGSTKDRLGKWIEAGGVLVRFAGPQLAHAATATTETDPLLPVRLRDGGRNLGGAMSWTTAQGLAPFTADLPFAGLSVPAEVKINAQVLAEPTLDLADHTWARLADGTPLVTGARRGKGWVVLIHTSANAAWSNLALSGLFVDMLKRLVGLAEGRVGTKAGGPLAPMEVLDGFGHLGAPGGAATAITGDPNVTKPGPRHPPGLYGDAGSRFALNLSPSLGRPVPLVPPPGVRETRLGGQAVELDLKPGLLTAALALLVLDLLVALALRGLIGRRSASALVVLALLAPDNSHAADAFAMEAGLATRLAYVRTNDAATDKTSRAGLLGLSRIIGERSTANLAEPMAVDLEKDPVLFFPLLYWPMVPGQAPPSAKAVEKLNAYMKAGGLIVMDTGAEADATGQTDDAKLRALTQGLAIPPLAPVTEDHVLTRSFYLLKEMPGRFDGGTVWVADGQGPTNDGVSPVVVGGNDWAAAWAVDERGRAMFATVPGGERQRELAYRFGVNLVMYAMTGNYKADQVHVPAIMERLGR